MKDYIEERAVEIAVYIIENNATVRQTAKQFRISKSTVHKDVTERLLQINPTLAREARKVLDTNKSEPGRDGYERKIFASAWIMRQDHPVQSDVPDDFLYILVFGQ